MFRPQERQAGLFDDEGAWTIVFVSVPDLPEGVFGDIIRYAEPSFVFDLRLAPRFDMGSLNRERAFELFDRVRATYVDTTTPLMAGVKRPPGDLAALDGDFYQRLGATSQPDSS
jgi:hypothetical protein